MNTAQQLFAASALATRSVTVGGIDMTVRELSIRQRKQFADLARDGGESLGPWLVCTACIDVAGLPVFAPGDVEKMLDLSPQIIEALAREVMIASGLLDAKQ